MATETGPRRLAAWGLSLLLLATGALAGVAADRLAGGRRPGGGGFGPPTPERIVERLADDLDLTPPQRRAVAEIVEERWRALASVFERVDPEVEAIRNRANDRIRAVLDPAQRARFDAKVQELERRRAALRDRLHEARAVPP